jgi:YVTN family beta-propeller protein
VAEFDSDSVSILALDTSTVVRSAKVGKGPRGIAVDPQTGIVIVVNKLDNNAVFLDLNALLAVGNPQ